MDITYDKLASYIWKRTFFYILGLLKKYMEYFLESVYFFLFTTLFLSKSKLWSPPQQCLAI